MCRLSFKFHRVRVLKGVLGVCLTGVVSTYAASVDIRDAARDALVSSIERQVTPLASQARRLRAKALASLPDATRVRTASWKEVAQVGDVLVTNQVTGEIWTDAILAALTAKGAVHIPARAKPYYIDAPLVLAGGQALVADPGTEIRLKPQTDTCLLRNKTLVGMDHKSLKIPEVAYDRIIYVEGGIWTSLRVNNREANGNRTGRTQEKDSLFGAHGAFVFNHVEGLVVTGVTIRACQTHGVQLSDVHRFCVEGVAFQRQGRDGVHLHGACDFGVIRCISGDTADDFIALNAWDWRHTSPVVAPIHHILVEDCTCASKATGFKNAGSGAIRIQPGNRKCPNGRGSVACPVERCVFRRLTNVSTFKLYDQPNLELGRANDFSDPIGTMRQLYFYDLRYDRPGLIQVADNVDGLDISRVLFRYDAIGRDFVQIRPISGTYKHGPDPRQWVEIFSPDKNFTVRDFSLRNVSINADGLGTEMDPKAFLRVENGKLNPDYPKTTPRGGTGKVTFEWFPNVVDRPFFAGGEMPLDETVLKMETPADEARVKAWKKANAAPFWLVPEERRLAVRPDRVPAHWFASDAGPARVFKGEAEPDEDFVFQVCVMSDKARAFKWAVSCANAPKAVKILSKAQGRVGANGLQPLWVLVRVPRQARATTLQGNVGVTDVKTLETVVLPWELKVKDAEPIVRHGVDDAWRLARLAWLDSDVGASLTEPTRPFTRLEVTPETRTIKLLGRTLVLAENGLPAAYRTFFNGSCTKITQSPTDFLAAPISFAVNPNAGSRATSTFAFTERHPCRVSWKARTLTDEAIWRVEGSLEFDGFASFKIFVEPKEGVYSVACAPVLALTIPRTLARYQMGLGRPGGLFPETLDWKWDVSLQQDATWFGAPHAGMMMRFKGANWVRPLCNVYYKWRQLNLPESWGRGGIRFRTDAKNAVVTAFSGEQIVARGASPTWAFDLYLTPFKPTNLKTHLANRIHHFGQRTGKVNLPQLAEDGVNIVTFHHNTRWNPYINYPFNDDGGPLLKKAVQDAHASGLRLKVYYTTRELTQNVPEFFALMSLGDEVFFRCPPDMPGRTCINPAGPHPWLAEHVGQDILPAWRENVQFKDSYPPKPDLAVITQPDTRWNNYFLAGLDYLVRQYGIDGIYIDDTALDRVSMQRARRILDADGNTGRHIDMHSWNHASSAAGKGNSPMVFLELYPYYDLVWHGEGFRDDTPPEFWLVERSGVPFGLLGQYLGKANLFQTLVFAQTDRRGWCGGTPDPLWKFFDAYNLGDAELLGWWDDACPVKVVGVAPDKKTAEASVKATVYRLPKRTIVSVFNFSAKHATVQFVPDSSEKYAQVVLADMPGLQKPGAFDLARPCEVGARKGLVFVLER